MRARIKFEKLGPMIYVGHLDLMRFFQKAVKRSDLNIKYSEGYNPHQIMSFASPLGVGIESLGEYLDIDINNEISCEQAIKSLNENMTDGLKITSFKYLSDSDGKCMSSLEAASYMVKPRDNKAFDFDVSHFIDEFLSQESIIITKETKKGSREVDLKPLIYELYFKNNSFYMNISSGSVDNIKPELVLETFFQYINKPVFDMAITRIDMYTRVDEQLISMSEVGYVK